ncbi:MAG: 30S ribosomal protein S12 methylthiotransferase RimO [Acidimicrobiia bacterium]|nr:30S ribosomal protein S12 methylthiotransferase RimO [Acidimicrobiia bacterium]MDH3470340.1 30S ribosomal protein S12 methylthiotransferase RimO [Acidimicrobiia bacterium]
MTSPSVWLTTLGCAKNEVDSDKLTSVLDEAGYRRADSPESADVVMVNTCAFIEAARQESVETILSLGEAKATDAKLVVLGCMAQRYETELVEALPEADAVIGLDRYGELVERLDSMTNWAPVRMRTSKMDILYEVRRPTPTTPYAYVKVAEGCDKPCTFCAIPLFRGKQRSRPPVNIYEEVSQLGADGIGEVVLVAQDLAAYGRDIDAPGGIVDLLRFLSDVDGLRTMRLLYLYPKEIRPQLIEEMTSNPKIAPYFDLSLQHAAGALLRAMKRSGDGVRHLDLIDQIRLADADAALRSSFIVGFPGETEENVETLADFLTAAQLDWAGFFPFSPEEGTPAADLDGRVDTTEVAERMRHLQSIQEDITTQLNAAQVGRKLEVLVDMVEDGTPVGRSYRQAPEIDGVILLDRGEPGDWVQAEVVAAYETDLQATVI